MSSQELYSETMLGYREASYEDKTAIATIHADSWRIHYRGAYRDEFLDGDVLQDRMDVWENRLSTPPDNQFVVVGEEEGQIVGFACAYGRNDERWGTLLDNIHVRPERHRTGMGTRLVTEIARWCRANYADSGLYLWVLAQNIRAQRFYQHLGATDRGGELRVSSAGGSLVDVRRYAWTTVWEIVD